MNELQPKSALVITAQPGDVDYYCGGTLRIWINNGCKVALIVTASGDTESDDPSVNPQALIALRTYEQRASADKIGISKLDFLGFYDNEISYHNNFERIREKYVQSIREFRPEILLTYDPYTRIRYRHPNSNVVGKLAVESAFVAVRPMYYKHHILSDDLEPCQPSSLLLFDSDSPNYSVDISNAIEIKKSALNSHKSQIFTNNYNGLFSKIDPDLTLSDYQFGQENFLLNKVSQS